jgi:predicted nucleotidyltransferase
MAASHGLTNLRVFGSVVRGLEGPNSDIDLLVDVAPGVGLLELGRCQAELESLLGARIDLVPASDLKPAVRAEALCEAKAL